jgi:aminopeptidase N
MLRHQLAHGVNALTCCAAAEALSKKNDPTTVKALGESLLNEKEMWMVRAEAARALGKVRSDEALEGLIAAIATASPKVRRAVAGALGAFKTPQAAQVLAQLVKKEQSYVVVADAARSLGRTRQPRVLETLKAIVDKPSWADVIRAGALDGMAALRDEAALDVVTERTRYGVPTRGRRAAVHALASLGEGRRTREKLEELLEDKDPHFKIDVVSALTTLGDPKSRGALRRTLDRELDGRVARRIREALRDMSESPGSDKKRVNEELESLRDELIELKNRLAKIEGRKTEKASSPESKPTASSKAPTKASAAPPKKAAKAPQKTRKKRHR